MFIRYTIKYRFCGANAMTFDIPVKFIPENSTFSTVHNSALLLLTDIENESYQMFDSAVAEMKIIAEKYITVVACSFGKDSTVTLLVALKAHMELIAEGKISRDKPFVVCSIDTGVENHLVQMLTQHGCDQLKAFAEQNNINIDIRLGKPPLSKQWSALFLSGLKLISASRLNSDCSVILKLDNAATIERQIIADYGSDKLVTLLGSRLSESTKRAQSIRKFGNDITAEDLIQYDKADKVFAPIVDWTDDHVWTVLKRAGKSAISSSVCDNPNLFSYAPNHRLLHIVYSNSKDGSCPTSSKRIQGDKATQGGCGGSARTGCYLCAKSIKDKSAEAQAAMLRHSVISGNVLKVRNYIMTVAQSVQNRTWLAKAVDFTTGAIALQPNTLNAVTIDKLLWLLSQVTHDEINRASNFAKLVSKGLEMQDLGYADIINDDSMTVLDKAEMALAYRTYAVRPLITPMSLELSLYISAIHSRDGVKLPPYRAFYIWNATQSGERIPYPDVDPTSAVIDEIPDPVMVIPDAHVDFQAPFTLDGLFDFESASGCDANSVLLSEQVPVKIARYFMPKNELHKLEGLANTDTIQLAGLYKHELTKKMLLTPKSTAPKARFSKRAIKRVSRKAGGVKVLERGRTSLDKPSFGERVSTPNFIAKTTSPMHMYLPTQAREHGALVEIDSDQNGYEIDVESMVNWFDFDGAERALNAHDAFISSRDGHGEHMYAYSGTAVIESLLRNGVLRINSSSKTNLARILKRTAYFHSLGLLSIDDESIQRMTVDKDCSQSVVNKYRSIRASLDNNISKICSMQEFRAIKAKALLVLRTERNQARKIAKQSYEAFKSNPEQFALNQYETTFKSLLPMFNEAVQNVVIFSALIENKISFFDGNDIHNQLHTSKGVIEYIFAMAEDFSLVLTMFDKLVQSEFKHNPQSRSRLNDVLLQNYNLLVDAQARVTTQLTEAISNGEGGFTLWYLVLSSPAIKASVLNTLQKCVSKPKKVKEFKRSFSLSDSIVHTQNIVW
jgi:3'-phosphoadenosine 5'-phosphosulfate sulfotransferase (PAPS reductase)/FAD synthetase